MNKKRVIIHIIIPIILAIITNFICLKLFYIPDPTKPGTAVWATDAIAVGVFLFVLEMLIVIPILIVAVKDRKRVSVFCVMTGLSENTIRKARDSLKKIGLVEQFDIRTLGTKYKVKYDTLCPMIIKLNAEKNPVERLRLADKLRGKGREKNQKLIEMFQGSEFDFNC